MGGFKEMKITFVLPNIAIGGGVRVVFEYANRLQERGHEVSIVYPIIPPFSRDLLRQFGLKGAMLKFLKSRNSEKRNVWKTNAKLIRVSTLSQKLKRMFERKIPDADAIIATEWRTAYAVADLGEEKGKKYHLVQNYECWEVWNDERCWKRAEQISKKTGEPVHLAMADVDTSDLPFHNTKKLVDNAFKLPLRKITISSWLNELIENKFGQKVENVIINGVNFEKFYNENKTWNKKKRILAPYRDMKWKGAEDAIEAFKIVRKKFSDVQFAMFGPIKGEIPDWIKFRENVSDKELRELYSSCDIFVFPSWIEGFGLPPMEAMACRCAVITTDTGGTFDYVIPGETALVSPPRSPDSLAKNIIFLIENEEKLKDLSKAGYEYIKRFTWERATDKFENILKTYYKKVG